MELTDKQKEIWLPIKGYENLYEVSNIGNVRKPQRIGWRNSVVGGRTLKPKTTNNGYHMVVLSKNNINNYRNVHRIVAETFIKNIKDKTQVNHKDGNKLNNYASNLEWNTSKENIQHAKKLGLINNAGIANLSSKLNNAAIFEIRKNKNWNYGDKTQFAKKFGVSNTCICDIINKKTWRHI